MIGPRSRAIDLTHFPEALHNRAIEAFNEGDPEFLRFASNDYGIEIVCRNQELLRQRDFLERSFVRAATACRINNHFNYPVIRDLLRVMDRTILVAAGDLPPAGARWRVFRGIAGKGGARRIRGFSWTRDLDRARWFAKRAAALKLVDPAVYRTIIGRRHLLFFDNGRMEEEFFVQLSSRHPVERVR